MVLKTKEEVTEKKFSVIPLFSGESTKQVALLKQLSEVCLPRTEYGHLALYITGHKVVFEETSNSRYRSASRGAFFGADVLLAENLKKAVAALEKYFDISISFNEKEFGQSELIRIADTIHGMLRNKLEKNDVSHGSESFKQIAERILNPTHAM